MKNNKAFSLVEVLVVLAIVVILAALAASFNHENNSIVVIDGCQYIKTYTGGKFGGFALTHKGNCTNVMHKNDHSSGQ